MSNDRATPSSVHLTLWAMAGAAPTVGVRRAILAELGHITVDDVVRLLLDHPELGPAVGTLPEADLVITDEAASLCLAGALLADTAALHSVNRSLATVVSEQEAADQYAGSHALAYSGLAMNPHTPPAVARVTFDNIPGRGRATELAHARCRNHKKLGLRPPNGRDLATAFGSDRTLLQVGLSHFGDSLAVIRAATARLTHLEAARMRNDISVRLTSLVNAGCQPAVVRWALTTDSLAAKIGMLALADTSWQILADHSVRRFVIGYLCQSAAHRTQAVAVVAQAREHLTRANLRRLEEAHPGITGYGRLDGAALDAPAHVLVRELDGANADTWIQAARLMSHLQPGDPTSAADVVAASQVAAAASSSPGFEPAS